VIAAKPADLHVGTESFCATSDGVVRTKPGLISGSPTIPNVSPGLLLLCCRTVFGADRRARKGLGKPAASRRFKNEVHRSERNLILTARAIQATDL